MDFEITWIEGENTDPLHAKTAAELKIVVDDNTLTSVCDKRSQTIRDKIRVPLYPLAEWFAFNWWRIHKETYPDSGPLSQELLLAHSMASVGGGFVWPALEFYSDDQFMTVRFRKTGAEMWESVKYETESLNRRVKVKEFDKAVAGLIDLTVQRLHDLDIRDAPLTAVWSDVLAEMLDPDVRTWRETEARLGYDPDEAPENLIRIIENFSTEVGKNSAEEILPVLKPNETKTIKALHDLSSTPGLKAKLQIENDNLYKAAKRLPPWKAGRKLARDVRNHIGMSSGPVDDSNFAEILGARLKDFQSIKPVSDNIGISLGVKNGSANSMGLHFRRDRRTGQRFEAARFIADHLISHAEDKWLPLTDQATFRQKVQRAFAAEFLMPVEDLEDFMSDDFSDSKIKVAALRFAVSPLTVRSHLANHGIIPPDNVVVESGDK